MLKSASVLPLILLLFIGNLSFSQNLHLSSKSEKIQILGDSTFTKNIHVTFNTSKLPRLYPIIYDTELERVSNIELYEIKGKRLKKIKKNKIIEEKVNLDYITSKKIKSVYIPEEKDVLLKYSVSCDELMYLTSFPFFSYDEIDTLNYKIIVPNDFIFNHNFIYSDSIPAFQMDSSFVSGNHIYDLKVKPKKVEPDPLQMFGIYRNMKVPMMRTLVVPKSYDDDPINYMNDWYLNHVSKRRGLNKQSVSKIDELTHGITDKIEMINIIYNYVKSNFKYVAIEIGMGAFIPSHVNDVFKNKEGDCKDLSNFLSEALKYKGINSNLALAATFDHISDCDFPSLSSANHVICVAELDGNRILLDPTDSVHLAGSPVQSLQDQTILIISPEGGEFYDADKFTVQQNSINYQIELKTDSNNKIKGSFNIKYHGISSNNLRRILENLDQEAFVNYYSTLFSKIFGEQDLYSLEYSETPNEFHISGNIKVANKTLSDNSYLYIFLDFLPKLFDIEKEEDLIEGTYIGVPFSKKVSLTLDLNDPILSFEPIQHQIGGNGVTLDYLVKPINSNEIECNYNFTFDHIFIDKSNVDITNEVLSLFNKLINEPIVLNKQKS